MGLNNEDIKQLIAILQKGLVSEDDQTETTTPRKNKPTKKTVKKKQTSNLFDSMSEASMHQEDIEIDKKLHKSPPSQRSRSYRPIRVRCRVCGKEETVNPSLVESMDRYKCNRCATSPG